MSPNHGFSDETRFLRHWIYGRWRIGRETLELKHLRDIARGQQVSGAAL